jgi:hypothetical protein
MAAEIWTRRTGVYGDGSNPRLFTQEMKWRMIKNPKDEALRTLKSDIARGKARLGPKFVLNLTIGDRVCLLRNLDASKELVNGKLG